MTISLPEDRPREPDFVHRGVRFRYSPEAAYDLSEMGILIKPLMIASIDTMCYMEDILLDADGEMRLYIEKSAAGLMFYTRHFPAEPK